MSIRPNPHTVSTRGSAWHIDEAENSITNLSDGLTYNFDSIYPADRVVSNAEVYARLCAPLVRSFLTDGYNATLFAYGMTGSGKTYSMRGEDHDPGFVRLAIDDLFAKIESDGRTHALSLAYVEIYNEKIVDLLGGPGASDLKIRDDNEFGTKVVGITSPEILLKSHMLQLIKLGDTRRRTSATDYNSRSSRSHSIIQIRLQSIDSMAGTEARCTLSLCDLAGSERATSSAQRRKEGAFINKSLLALSNVINKLSLHSTAAGLLEHIPYRDSKLTRLLQPALSGSLLIVILCTVHLGAAHPSQDQQVITETSNTLRFAARAKDIVMDVRPKRQSLGENQKMLELQLVIASQQRELDAQRAEIEALRLHGPRDNVLQPTGATDTLNAELRAEIRVQKEKIEHLNRLNDLQKTETVLLRNDALNDILGMDLDKGPQTMILNLEEFYKRVNHEVEEYKTYIETLERQLKAAYSTEKATLSDRHIQSLLSEQEEEIWQLRETIKDKDQIIHSLTKTSKLRRLVDLNSSEGKRPSYMPGYGKENEFY